MSTAIWNEVECGDYTADLPLWEELADATDEPIVELGCGAGRVTLHLAQRGARTVVGLDHDADLIAAIRERAGGKLAGDAEVADVRAFELPTRFGLAIAPMQLVQLLADSAERVACLACVAKALLPGGRAAFAIVEELPAAADGAAPPLPDVRQMEGWIYSSLPLDTVVRAGSILLRRLRQTVDPDGTMSEELDEVELAVLTASILEDEGCRVGLRPLERREIRATDAHVGSTVVVFERVA